MSPHPSFLELDRLALGETTGGEHIADCARCRDHIDRLKRPEPVPAWVGGLPARRPRWTWAWGGGLALAAAVVLFLVVRPDGGEEFTTVKGSPTVAVHIKRGDEVMLWDGVQPVLPGDRLRLEVAPDGFRYLQVFTAGEVLLYQGALPERGPTLVPKAWEVDDRPGPETLIVVMSAGPVTAASLARDPEPGIWRTTLILPKTEEP
jgi:hypothetical protein